MISILPTAAPAPDAAGNPAFPLAAADAADAPLGLDGKPIPFALLLGIALDSAPAADPLAAAVADAVPADAKPDEDLPALPAAATDAVAMLLPAGAPPVTPPPATTAATPPDDAPGPARVDTAAPRGAAPTAPVAKERPAAAPVETAATRETVPDAAALPPVVVPGKAEVAGAPDTPAAPVAAPVAPAPAAEAPSYHARVAAPVHAPEFPREFAAQVHVAVQRGIEQASIAVNPPELGPVEVRLEIHNGEARVHFAAESAATRDAITDAMPKLREMLGAQGLALSGSTVGAELPQREQPGAPRQDGGPATQASGAPRAGDDGPLPAARTTLRLVDVFA